MSSNIEFLEKHWQAISAHPWIFLEVAVIAFGLGIALSQIWNARSMELMNHRLAIKDDTISGYQERLGIVPRDATKYSKLTDAELREFTMNLVGRIRAFVSSQTVPPHVPYDPEVGVEEFKKQWFQRVNRTNQEAFNRMQEFKEKFQAESIALRDELYSRLPPNSNRISRMKYDAVMGDYMMQEIASDLERMAMMLTR